MAESNVRQLSPPLQLGCDTSTPEKVMPFTSADAHRVREWVLQARAIVRAVALAVTAQEDGSVSYDNGPEERWWASLDLVCSKLGAVRDLLSSRRNAPDVDWFTPLNVLEAVGAAAWHATGSRAGEDQLDAEEIRLALGVEVECLERLASECADACTEVNARAA
ncbi:hypothetical protein [Hydrogenophaga sp.]|uniref:hypothetical protein n=1 Tax=Hydrogenophaga sp. TaxID=1904254 RepID=UPI002731B1F2|nr:hypothetical protein [Hydrogenophaga sp.]MDP2018644.1 hypothetical protein [Hydrogenophaga sp.]MDP3167231.1 hypothetical protein [Hydrogenophaga sp.]